MHKQQLVNELPKALIPDEVRLAQLKKLKRAFTGLIGDDQSIQRMKADRAESLKEEQITSPHTTPPDQP